MPATTSSVPSGDALVVVGGEVLGWWSEGEWQSQSDFLPLRAGEDLVAFALGNPPVEVEGGEPELFCDGTNIPIYRIPVDPGPFGPNFTGGWIGVSAPWTVEPGSHEPVEPTLEVQAAASELLEQAGIDDETPAFTQVLETDLDNDSVPEALVTLDHEAGVFGAPDDAYGISFFVGEDGGVQVLGPYAGYSPVEGAHMVSVYRFLAIVDVNGDGSAEVAMREASYEYWATLLLELDQESGELVEALSVGCGA